MPSVDHMSLKTGPLAELRLGESTFRIAVLEQSEELLLAQERTNDNRFASWTVVRVALLEDSTTKDDYEEGEYEDFLAANAFILDSITALPTSPGPVSLGSWSDIVHELKARALPILIQMRPKWSILAGYIGEVGKDKFMMNSLDSGGEPSKLISVSFDRLDRVAWGGGYLETLHVVAEHRAALRDPNPVLRASALKRQAEVLLARRASVELVTRLGTTLGDRPDAGILRAVAGDFLILQCLSDENGLEDLVAVRLDCIESIEQLPDESDHGVLALELLDRFPPPLSLAHSTFHEFVHSLAERRAIVGLDFEHDEEVYEEAVVRIETIHRGHIAYRPISLWGSLGELEEVPIESVSAVYRGGGYRESYELALELLGTKGRNEDPD